ncbi:MAG TPA: hypothetical protein VIG30_03720 [Ktedonobacterales bacterium]
MTACAECRRAEAGFRSVGESLRQLPSITPPASFRARVFAAIGEEEASRTPALVRLTTDETQPRLPVVRRRAEGAPRRPIVFGRPAAIAVAAVLLLGLVGARLIPAISHNLSSVAASLANLSSNNDAHPNAPHIAHYRAPAGSGTIGSALASTHWVAYAAGQPGAYQLYATSRASGRTAALLPAPQSGTLSVRGLSDHWVLWLAGDGTSAAAWTLWASPLPAMGAPAAAPPIALVASGSALSALGGDAPALFDGAWMANDTVLAALVAQSGQTLVVRFDLAPGQASASARVVAHGTAGHLFSDPALAGGRYYWADVWADAHDTLHSDIWRGDDNGQVAALTFDGEAFAPRLAGQSLVVVRSGGPALLDAAALAAQPDQAMQSTLQQIGGTVATESLSGGSTHQIGTHAQAVTLAASSTLIVWRDGAQVHTFDLSRHAPSAIDADVRGASFAGATSTSLAWGQAGSTTISVYDPN